MIDKYDPHPDADPSCYICRGYGYIRFGNICTGFGGKLGELFPCNCTLGFWAKKKSKNIPKWKKWEEEFIGLGIE